MFWLSRNGRFEIALNLSQWMVGVNWHGGLNTNLFLGPLRFGYNHSLYAYGLRRTTPK